MDFQYVDDVVRVNDKECFAMTRRLAREEGIFAGVSSGAAVAGALKWIRENDREGMVVVILLPDGGARYLSKAYSDQWMSENGFLDEAPSLGKVADLLEALPDRAPVTVADTVDAAEAIGLLKQHAISQVPVLRDGRVVGILHERTLLESALKPGTPGRAGELATHDYCVVERTTDVAVLSDLFRKTRVALVMQGEALLAVLTRIDVIDHVARVTTPS